LSKSAVLESWWPLTELSLNLDTTNYGMLGSLPARLLLQVCVSRSLRSAARPKPRKLAGEPHATILVACSKGLTVFPPIPELRLKSRTATRAVHTSPVFGFDLSSRA
jgi:hypothetical protein